MDLEALVVEVADLHRDAREAARVAELCAVVAGQRLEQIRATMGASAWSKWVARLGAS